MLGQMSRLSIILSARLCFSVFYKTTTAHSTIPAEDPACLTNEEAQSIASQYIQIFNTNSTNQPTTNKEILSTLIGPDYTEINGDSILCSDSHGKTECGFIGSVPLFRNREQVLRAYESLGLGAATNDVTRECQTRVVHALASCDEIAIRYEAEGRANNGVRGVTAADETPVQWLGTSLLKVDLQTRMIERAETSEDRLVLYQQLGITDLNELLKVQL